MANSIGLMAGYFYVFFAKEEKFVRVFKSASISLAVGIISFTVPYLIISIGKINVIKLLIFI